MHHMGVSINDGTWVPQNWWFTMELFIKVGDLGVPPFQKTSICLECHSHLQVAGLCQNKPRHPWTCKADAEEKKSMGAASEASANKAPASKASVVGLAWAGCAWGVFQNKAESNSNHPFWYVLMLSLSVGNQGMQSRALWDHRVCGLAVNGSD